MKTDRQNKGTWLRVQLLPEKLTNRLPVLTHLFTKAVFRAASLISAVWLAAILILYCPRKAAAVYLSLTASQIGWWLIGIAVISLFHELGHVSALLYCGGKPGGIGLSIRFFLPKGWSELNGIEKLSSPERMYVDLGGIIFQLLLTESAFAVNALWLQNKVVTAVCVASAHMALINLIPNPGSDGYWLIKDCFGIEDITAKANKMFGNRSKQAEKRDWEEVRITVFLLITRNIALIYLLVLVVTVSAAAAGTVFQDLQTGLLSSGRLTAVAVRRFLSRRLGSLAFLMITLQNAVSSVVQARKRGKQGTARGQNFS